MNDTTFQGNGKVAYVPVVVNAKPPKQTNADRIRAMTDEEMAFYIVNHPKWFDEQTCLSWLKLEVDDGQTP